MVASSTKSRIVDQRGDQNIPKWYLKSTRWNLEDDISELPLGPGYYIINPDEGKDDWIPVDFDFNALWWGLMYQWKSDGKFEIYQPAPSKYGLWIYGEERIWDRSQWGPIDGTTDTEEGINFQFRSDVDNTPEPEPEDISVPTIDQVERLESTIADLAGLLSSHLLWTLWARRYSMWVGSVGSRWSVSSVVLSGWGFNSQVGTDVEEETKEPCDCAR